MATSFSCNLPQAVASGFAGALVLNVLHETVRRIRPNDAPRMDLLGERGLRKLLASAGAPQPNHATAYKLTLAGDILSNGLYYSLVGTGTGVWWRGAALGLAAGVGGVLLPGPLGLGKAPSNRTPQTKAMTVTWYLVGGLAAAATSWALNKVQEANGPQS
ncbi:hypothetical protein ACFPAF_11110 [Hymenobacter endophyticus]|uniref:DUF1440 domain-containing protein n=1 Tax=Hymenobacter endophyticus TaxID=3076335 RepID=A0ABU3THT9_9BACT|nr:hypothetical protein [Hymenobacter endophyticus]MDU0370946.1 hypothetical protein [Hymenobacter endophyticus]